MLCLLTKLMAVYNIYSELDEERKTVEYCSTAFKSNVGSIRYIPKNILVESIRMATTDMLNNPDQTYFEHFVEDLDRRLDDDYSCL